MIDTSISSLRRFMTYYYYRSVSHFLPRLLEIIMPSSEASIFQDDRLKYLFMAHVGLCDYIAVSLVAAIDIMTAPAHFYGFHYTAYGICMHLLCAYILAVFRMLRERQRQDAINIDFF